MNDTPTALLPKMLAVIHGSAYQGDGASLLLGLRDALERDGID